MPYLVTTSNHPTHIADVVAKKYIEMLKKYPPDESLGDLIMVGSKRTKSGTKTMGIVNVKKGKLEEIITRANMQLAMFNNIAGFEAKIEVWTTVEEGFASLGIEPPS